MGTRTFLQRLRAGREHAVHRPAPADSAPAAPAPRSPASQWFWDHYEMAAGQVIDAFAAEAISPPHRPVADVGCGDGIIDLGLLHKARPRQLVGFDLNLTDREHLAR